jgi:hypothetical protein
MKRFHVHLGETTCCYARSERHWVTDPAARGKPIGIPLKSSSSCC